MPSPSVSDVHHVSVHSVLFRGICGLYTYIYIYKYIHTPIYIYTYIYIYIYIHTHTELDDGGCAQPERQRGAPRLRAQRAVWGLGLQLVCTRCFKIGTAWGVGHARFGGGGGRGGTVKVWGVACA